MVSNSAVLVTLSLALKISAMNSRTEEAQATLKVLKDTVNAEINAAFSSYTSTSQAIDTYSLSSKVNGTNLIQSYADEYLLQFEIIKNASLETGLDITPCLDQVEHYITNLGPESEENFNQCVDMVLEQALELIRSKVMQTVDKVFSIVIKDEKDLVQCGSSDACLSRNVVKIEVDADIARMTLAGLIQDYVHVYQMYPSTIGDMCIRRYIPTAIGKGQSLIENFQKCVDVYAGDTSR